MSSHPPLFLRFTHKNSIDLITFKGFLRNYKCKFITCLEHGEREHTHTLIFPNQSIDSFRKRLVSKFKNYTAGNADYSLKTADTNLENVERYICKGENANYEYLKNPVIFDFLDYDYFLIEQRHKEYWERNKEIVIENLITKKKQEKQKKKTWTENLVADWLSSGRSLSGRSYDIINKRMVLDFVLERFRKDIKGFDKNILQRACNAIWAIGNNNDFIGDMFCQVYPEDAFAYKQYYA